MAKAKAKGKGKGKAFLREDLPVRLSMLCHGGAPGDAGCCRECFQQAPARRAASAPLPVAAREGAGLGSTAGDACSLPGTQGLHIIGMERADDY